MGKRVNKRISMLGLKLIALGIITQEQLQEALNEQKKIGKRLGEILVDKGYASKEQIDSALNLMD